MPFKLNPTTGKLDFYEEITTLPAVDITYNNTGTFLTATNVQDAIDQGNKGIYPLNMWVNFLPNYTTPSNNSISANFVKGVVSYIDSVVKVDRVRMLVGTASSGSAVIGIYKYTNVNTWTLISQALGTINLGSNTVQELLFLNEVTLTKGVYAFCINLQNATIIQCVGAGATRTLFGYASGMQISAHGTAVYFAQTYSGTLPNTLTGNAGTADGSAYPHLIFKVTG
jgi:hypothetical protein